VLPQQLVRPPSQGQAKCGGTHQDPSYLLGGSPFEATWYKSAKPYMKNKLKAEGLGDVVQMVECFPSKGEALSSKPSYH
jgi:hypothetical protein